MHTVYTIDPQIKICDVSNIGRPVVTDGTHKMCIIWLPIFGLQNLWIGKSRSDFIVLFYWYNPYRTKILHVSGTFCDPSWIFVQSCKHGCGYWRDDKSVTDGTIEKMIIMSLKTAILWFKFVFSILVTIVQFLCINIVYFKQQFVYNFFDCFYQSLWYSWPISDGSRSFCFEVSFEK